MNVRMKHRRGLCFMNGGVCASNQRIPQSQMTIGKMSKYEQCSTLVFSDFHALNETYNIFQGEERRWNRKTSGETNTLPLKLLNQ